VEIFKDYDVIIDGTTNFPTRYLVNTLPQGGRARRARPIFRFEAMVSGLQAARGPLLRCQVPEPPPADLPRPAPKPACWAVLPASSQHPGHGPSAHHWGLGDPLVGRLLAYDAPRIVPPFKVPRDPSAQLLHRPAQLAIAE